MNMANRNPMPHHEELQTRVTLHLCQLALDPSNDSVREALKYEREQLQLHLNWMEAHRPVTREKVQGKSAAPKPAKPLRLMTLAVAEACPFCQRQPEHNVADGLSWFRCNTNDCPISSVGPIFCSVEAWNKRTY